MINRNNSCIWILEEKKNALKKKQINRNNSCIWIVEHEDLSDNQYRLIETIVVFESGKFRSTYAQSLINRNNSCIWIERITLFIMSGSGLIETIVVFEYY